MNEIQYEKPPGTESPSTDQRQKFVFNEFRDESAELNPFPAEPEVEIRTLLASGTQWCSGDNAVVVTGFYDFTRMKGGQPVPGRRGSRCCLSRMAANG